MSSREVARISAHENNVAATHQDAACCSDAYAFVV
jgi:hypothetical protein